MLGYLISNIKKIPRWMRSTSEVRFNLNRALWENAGYPYAHLKPVSLAAIFPGIHAIDDAIQIIRPFQRRRGTSIELGELIVLLSIVRFTGARRVVEIGTFDGNSALNYAANVGAQGHVVTIDLPPAEGDAPAPGMERKPTEFDHRQYADHPLSARIEQVYGDSAALDWSAVGRDFDFGFIDGDHSEAYVRSDTRKMLSVIRPGGVIAWHDYDMPTVTAPLDAAVRKGANLSWIRGTRIVVATIEQPDAMVEFFSDS